MAWNKSLYDIHDYFELNSLNVHNFLQPADEKIVPPRKNITLLAECGMRNSAGVGVRITGGGDGETEYGGMEIVAFRPIDLNLRH